MNSQRNSGEYDILSWNVNGLKSACREGFVDTIREIAPAIICLQETKIVPSSITTQLTNLSGYQVYWEVGEVNGRNGVAIITSLEPESVTSGIGDHEFDCEGRSITAEFQHFVLCNVYCPHGCNARSPLQRKISFFQSLQRHVRRLCAQSKPVILVGDFNTAHHEIDLSRPDIRAKYSGFLPVERLLIDDFLDMGLVDIFRMVNPNTQQFTWWNHGTIRKNRNADGWRIDYFLVSSSLTQRIRSAFILDNTMGSDHCPIGITVSPP